MTDRRRSSDRQDRPGEEDNPFAPPPEGQPDRPWQPRHSGGSDQRRDGEGEDADGGKGRGEGGGQDGGDDQRQRWGSQWSRRQPKRGGGGFGEPPGEQERGGPAGGPGGTSRWDPSDPGQRHARYAVLAGMWGVFGGLLGWEWLALLLGALALYWGISALRGGPREPSEPRNRRLEALQGKQEAPPPPPTRPPGAAPGGPGGRGARPQFAAAVSGIVLASAALFIVAATYTVQLVYKDYFDCVDDALTTPSREACEELLPSQLRPILGEQD
ncbi:hypothetical protein [Streptomyces radicis]|uniref:Integral membrane protein n=1 Tax=Streptomyces radicis TaxID=1750517 RepID=A0A3A9WGI6_9ACTN|nr:hypothetical protein [Streptomyces radicis]RKN05207.1 hypothetical protein D7319_25895 [Streptomyces radicis]RKN16740.1 hypothetical protein D7318_25260 [Streptomyces radicis]